MNSAEIKVGSKVVEIKSGQIWIVVAFMNGRPSFKRAGKLGGPVGLPYSKIGEYTVK